MPHPVLFFWRLRIGKAPRVPLTHVSACRKAVIPAAGVGARMRPITKTVPKELFPAGARPVLQVVLEEAVASGLTHVCIVTRPGKEALRHYLTAGVPEPALDGLLAACEIDWVVQREPGGLGDALLQARDWVGDEPFAMLIPDQLFHGEPPAARQILDRWRPGAGVWSSLVALPRDELPFFPGARGLRVSEAGEPGVVRVEGLATEEETRAAFEGEPREWRAFGRTLFSPEVFRYLGPEYKNPVTGEVDLAKTFDACTREVPHYAVRLQGEAFDLGTFAGYYHFLPRLWELQSRH